ncbi:MULTISPECIES: hypothetical protein [unclassified Oceanispirochaeta]|uniref:hypothetical protein n=1 Tax=unclassified Oceanispirochaeta TaxID=2635722 RepID=UPI0011C04F24|nr:MULTISPECIES: hypothetical protein [unclassified Oceanispirochaeta]MBF9019000.1 hypothetical protein [Oceanispirochaeta sp. M2]NPD75500.1 hypothetical protein [Oceanispirochaeta sp. M1]
MVSGTAFGLRTDVKPRIPWFSESSGTLDQGTVITISGEEKYKNDKAYTILYMTSDMDHFAVYKGEEFILDKPLKITAYARYNPYPDFYESDAQSRYAYGEYKVKMPGLVITPAPGVYYKGQTVKLDCGRVPVLEYSFDGTSWKAYTTPLVLDRSKNIFARAKWSTFTTVYKAEYVVGGPPTPRIMRDPGAYDQNTSVPFYPGDDRFYLTVNNDGSSKLQNAKHYYGSRKNSNDFLETIPVDPRSVLEYSFDGTTWATYTEPPRLADSTTIYARSRALGPDPRAGSLSKVVSVDYIVNVPMPHFALTGGAYPKGTSIQITGDPRFILEYTPVGSHEWMEYKGPLVLEKEGTICARSREAGVNGAPDRHSGSMLGQYTIMESAIHRAKGVVAYVRERQMAIIVEDTTRKKWYYEFKGPALIDPEYLMMGARVDFDVDLRGRKPVITRIELSR